MLKNSQLLKKQVEYQKYKGKSQGVSINRDLINFTVLIILENCWMTYLGKLVMLSAIPTGSINMS